MNLRAQFAANHNTLTFELDYPISAQELWNYVSNPAQMKHWFPFAPRYEPVVGSPIYFSGDKYSPDFEGTILSYKEGEELAFDWGGSTLELFVKEESNGARIILIDHLITEQEAARNAAGWEQCLAELDKLVAGQPAQGPHDETAISWKPIYEAYLAAGFPHGAEVPDEAIS